MQTEEAIQKVVYLLPRERQGLQPVAICLFSESTEVQKIALRVIQRLQQADIGRKAYAALPEFFKIRLTTLMH